MPAPEDLILLRFFAVVAFGTTVSLKLKIQLIFAYAAKRKQQT